jgi:hypothetical protein
MPLIRRNKLPANITERVAFFDPDNGFWARTTDGCQNDESALI